MMTTSAVAPPIAFRGRLSVPENETERQAVEDLRRSAYLRAPEFTVLDDSAYRWTEADDNGFVLTVWVADGTALATMRGTVAPQRTDAEHHFECSVPLDESYFPALLLERGATREDRSCSGLNSLLRLHFFDAAMRSNVRSVMGAVFTGASRMKLLEELGYAFVRPEHVWDQNIKIQSSLLIASLPAAELGGAASKLRVKIGHLIHAFPLAGQVQCAIDTRCTAAMAPAGLRAF
jgi:hypothetical protein